MMRTGIVIPLELVLLHKDGSEYLCETETTVMHDSSGNAIGLIIVQRDITERRRAEEKLRESEEKYREVVERANDGIIKIDRASHMRSPVEGVRQRVYRQA